MKVIHNQAEFDSMFVTNLSTLPQNEIIRILPIKDGYNVNAPIVITKSNVIIQGYGKVRPKLKYVGANLTKQAGILTFVGTVGAELENIIVEGLELDGVNKSAINLYGIHCVYCGLAQTTGLTNGGYDASTVGKDKVNKIGMIIKKCIFKNVTRSGIAMLASSNTRIENNVLKNNINHGIELYNCSSYVVIRNRMQNNGQYGIWLSTVGNSLINNNIFSDNADLGVGFVNFCKNNTVTGNILQNNINCGMRMHSTENNTVIGNVILDNGYGVYIEASSNNNTLTGNTFQNNKTIGISQNATSANNVIEANTITQATSAHIDSSGNYALILGNIMTGTGTGITMSGTGSKQVDNVKV